MLPHGKKHNKNIRDCIKKINPNCKIVLGGPYAIDVHWNRDFDYVVVGYAESSIVNLAHHLVDNNIKLEKSYRSINGFTIVDDRKAENFNFSNSFLTYCDHDVILPNETLVIEISRGCIFKCKFCSYPLNGKKKLDFIRSKDFITKELLNNYERFGVTRYIFSDDTVNDSVEKCQMIYEISQSLPFKLEWWGYIRLDLMAAHPETQDLLFGSGLKSAYFGIETFNAESASAIGKSGNRQKLISTLRKIKNKWKNSVTLHGSFIYGLPYEDLHSLQQTTDFLLSDQNPLDSWNINPLSIRRDNTFNSFVSDIDTNWQKYGYENIGSVYPGNSNLMLWKSQEIDYFSALSCTNEVMRKNRTTSRLSGYWAFEAAGLGFDLDKFLNKKHDEIDWYKVDQQKLRRSVQYKQKLFKALRVELPNKYEQEFFNSIQTFSNFLANETAKNHLDIVI